MAIDTSVLAYAEGLHGIDKRDTARDIVRYLPQGAVAIPVQALGELFDVLTRKGGRTPVQARDAVSSWRDAFQLIETTHDAMLAAMDLVVVHDLSIWDAVSLSVSAKAGCRLFLSDKLQDGFTWGGLTVASPFACTRHALLVELMSPRTSH
ncbi:PIN domain-containing protein [Bordetella ansorpii]|uniref:PIN domain-containing protein n=1 Tax=Bordetella ansorpii TaxID=288768 RepID=UPI001C48ABD4|nr:PIN domain-containing protein [Bordetella ansorpii]